jgi:phosphoribosylformimino-5-aminoimidazole carboxamide ribotide isomerase
MFELYPAIDIHQGRCVRLTQGDYATAQIYDESPANAALRWQSAGATQLHVVDLDGAKAGHPVNTAAIAAICAAVTIPVQLGGGIRTHADVATVRSLGVRRTIIGTKAVADPAFVRDLVPMMVRRNHRRCRCPRRLRTYCRLVGWLTGHRH